MLINAAQPEEVRVAVMDHGVLDAFFVERKGKSQVAGNIYRGRVVNAEPSLQAAFVDLGDERNGFLHVSDVIPPDGGYADLLGRKSDKRGRDKDVGEEINGSGRRRATQPIERMLSRGQDVLVQITREGLGTKGATLTTYLSLPGKYLVLMPGIARHGVSKKIADENERKRLKAMLEKADPPEDMGVIVRTAGRHASADDLARDLDHLMALWEALGERVKSTRAPAPIYLEGDLVIRAIRDTLTSDTDEIVIDDQEMYDKARQFLAAVMPGVQTKVTLYEGPQPLFHKYGAEAQLDRLFDRHVDLKSGASIIIEQTEAMVTIDVNTGKFRRRLTNEETILAVNLEAAREVARQLRLRDIGGLVMIDFIDMDNPAHREKVEQTLQDGLAVDKARTRVSEISELGVLEMTRQRVRPSLRGTLYGACPHCGGTGTVRSRESTGLDLVRMLRAALEKTDAQVIRAEMAADTALFVSNKYRQTLAKMESETGAQILITATDELGPAEIRLYTGADERHMRLFSA